MKLLFCPHCEDIFKLEKELKVCKCGKNHGRYVDDINAEVSGDSIILGFENSSFIQAVRSYIKNPEGTKVYGKYYRRKGPDFNAFVVPEHVDSVTRTSENLWLADMQKKISR